MTDLSSGWFALGGTLIGVTGTQVAAIINATSKGRARKLKNQRQDKAAKAVKRRALYEQLIGHMDKAEVLSAKALASMGFEDVYHYADAVREVLEPVRSTCISVQIDGSEQARTIATDLLGATHELWLQATLRAGDDVDEDALEVAHDALVLGHAGMVDVARTDFGG